jgi:uncharacterized membrane protein
MLKALKPLIISSFILVLSLVALQLTAPTASARRGGGGGGTGATTGDVDKLEFTSGNKPTTETCNTNANASKLNTLIKNIINIFSILVGIVAVIMIIVGGFRYITSGGDSGNVTTAKNTILYAIVGLVIVALAQFIVRFVLEKSTNLT